MLEPGGGLELAQDGKTDGRPLSKLPETRMAAAMDDARELAQLDPHNQERWTRVQSSGGEIDGWTFYLTPPFVNGQFKFLTFRNPARRNLWDISPLNPNLDEVRGHTEHVIGTRMGGRDIAILCGPGGEPSDNLSAVRGVAAKWMAYTAARIAGRNPGFSL